MQALAKVAMTALLMTFVLDVASHSRFARYPGVCGDAYVVLFIPSRRQSQA